MTDPLSLLRYYNINKLPIRKENDKIFFDDHGYSWLKTVKTNYVIFRQVTAFVNYSFDFSQIFCFVYVMLWCCLCDSQIAIVIYY